MLTEISSIRAFVEPGPMPKRVWFYAQRRELAALRPLYALAIGFALGFVTFAGLGLAIIFIR